MSYVLCNEKSDVYLLEVMHNTSKVLQCVECKFVPEDENGNRLEPDPVFHYCKFIDQHLKLHCFAGHKVPASMFTSIRRSSNTWLKD